MTDMENDSYDLLLPADFSDVKTVDWLVEDGDEVEVGDPIAIAEKDGERFFAVSPVSGSIQILSNAPLFVAGLTLLIAYIVGRNIKSEKVMSNDPKFSRSREAYMAKLRDVVKDAVRADFQSVNKSISGLDVRLSGVESRLSAVDSRLSGVDTKLVAVDAGINSIKAHFKIK